MEKYIKYSYIIRATCITILLVLFCSCSTVNFHDYYNPDLHERNFEKCRIEIGQEHRNTMEWQRCMVMA